MPDFIDFDLLNFARGPALRISLGIFVLGITWRLVRLFLMPRINVSSVSRVGAGSVMLGGVTEFFRKMRTGKAFAGRTTLSQINGWVFHVGLLIVVVGLGAHIMFIKHLFGVSWPNLPSNVVFLVAVVTLVSLLAALYHRMTSPVLRIISTSNDYFTWFVTTLPLVTGLLATMHLGLRYETLLALHILSICLLLIWFPFGKLMHAFLVFVTRGKTGMEKARRGVVS